MAAYPSAPGPFASLIGVTGARFLTEGGCEVEMTVDDRHQNAGGVVHGGVVTALLDMCMGAAVVQTLEEDEWCATTSLTTDFMRPFTTGKLVARGRVERRGKLTAFPAGELLGDDGTVIARATGVWAIRRG